MGNRQSRGGQPGCCRSGLGQDGGRAAWGLGKKGELKQRRFSLPSHTPHNPPNSPRQVGLGRHRVHQLGRGRVVHVGRGAGGVGQLLVCDGTRARERRRVVGLGQVGLVEPGVDDLHLGPGGVGVVGLLADEDAKWWGGGGE